MKTTLKQAIKHNVLDYYPNYNTNCHEYEHRQFLFLEAMVALKRAVGLMTC